MKPVSFVLPASKNVIRLVRMGCSNRPYYQIGVMPSERRHGLPANEVIGSYDPMPNERNEKLFAVDLDRLAYWIGEGASVTVPLSSLLGKLLLISTNSTLHLLNC